MRSQGSLTILSGPPASGKSLYTKLLKEDPECKVFFTFEGHNEKSVLDSIESMLNAGHDVIYETTHTIKEISEVLLDRARTIELFRRDN